MPVIAPDTPAPAFALPSTLAGPVSLGDLLAAGTTRVMFVTDDCPTCELALRRLAAAGAEVAVVCEADPAAAARLAHRTGFGGVMLSEPAAVRDIAGLRPRCRADHDRDRSGRRGRGGRRRLGRGRAGRALLGVDLTAEAPLRKPGCAAKSTYDAAQLAADAAPGDDDPEALYELGWTDGLPVVAPTPERVAAMLAGRDPHRSLGAVPPGMGEATLERVAVCAVLAGCRPEHFAVVAAAAEAMLEPGFNLHGQAVTTQPCGQIAVVNGPARHTAGLNFGMGALGPGTRGNATIGRALRLLVSLTGEGMPGRLDRSTLGQPGKVGVCLAEDEARSPWPPLHVERGFPAAASVVTMFAGDAPLSVSGASQPHAGGAGGGARLGRGHALEPQLVAARLGDPVRRLPRARRHARRRRLEQGRRARGDLGGGAPARRRASPRRDDRPGRGRRPTMRSCPSGTRPTTSS